MGKCTSAKLDQPLVELDSVGTLTFHQFSVALSTVFTIVACSFSSYLIYKHASHYNRPTEQKQIIRILLMVPIYSITTVLAIQYYEQHVYLETVHQLYEAFVLASFFILLCRYMAPTTRELEDCFQEIVPRHWIPPIKWLAMCTGGPTRGWFRTPRSGVKYVHVISVGVLQYSMTKFLATIVTFVTEATDHYCAESKSASHAAIWIKSIQIVSLVIAMIFLMQFYLQFNDALKYHNPFLKFLAIKFVVFLSYVQTITLNFLTSGDSPAINPSDKISYQSLEVGIPNMILSIEMAIAAIIHLWAYPWHGYASAGVEEDLSELQESDSSEREMTPAKGGARTPLFGSAWRIFVDVVNFWDLAQAMAYSVGWLFVGNKRVRTGLIR